ncbi:MAG TPA: UDP-N-acetylmuramoyl-L-alanyl-D-glutamate--2,6-diaminopimelate ligase [Candidatus Lustribacter sp.]|jgi:UDP-N-acetylmuramoyl-L-alanyl-D-glutamate--2,6-diaminopimelate ligase|nr:UDP-N-acetylmuramoyl-L-alanyl-D-glutamate--2,6-diaminopimelate ligase [Candidatus Lustribacter sp.]
MRELAPLVDALAAPRIVGTLPPTITELSVDSRTAQPGSLFVAVRGERVDGHRYAKNAVARGSVALVVESAVDVDVPQIVVDDTRAAISRLADTFYDHPSHALTIFGVTGTNGKTTTTYLVRAIAEAAGIPCGVIGTLGGVFGEHTWALDNTTPLAVELHHLLAEMRAAGARAVAMEVSSHALALGRVDDVRFRAAALTNVTRDHLDFHGTLAHYIAAKRHLFDLAPLAVLNVDDAVGRTFAGEFATATTYAIERVAQLRAANIVLQGDGTSFDAGGLHVELALPGRFNIANALAAIGLARAAGIEDGAIERGLAAARAVPGRMERIGAFGIDVIVDYAHTPDALANVLRAARETTRGRLIVVFGCGGDRDAGKRVEMGHIAAAAADAVIVTSDNPRGENPAAIAAAVADGIVAEVILDRRTAIRRAINDARAGDTVVVAGKGHETYQIIGEERLPFDDRDEVRSAFSLRSGALRA